MTEYVPLSKRPGYVPLAQGGGVLGGVARPKKGKSLWEQATSLIGGVPRGLATLGVLGGKSAVNLAVAPIRSAVDVATGNPGRGLARLGDTATLGLFTEGSRKHGFEGTVPLAAMLGTSMHGTATRLSDPAAYMVKMQEDGGLGMVLEDIGNLSLLAGGVGAGLSAAAKGAGAAGQAGRAAALARAAAATKRAAALGGATADAPLSVWRAAGRQARLRGVDPLLRGTKVAERYPFLVHSTSRAVKPKMQDYRAEHAWIGRRGRSTLIKGRQSPEVDAAGIMGYTGEGAWLAAATDALNQAPPPRMPRTGGGPAGPFRPVRSGAGGARRTALGNVRDWNRMGATWRDHEAQQAAIQQFDSLPDDALVAVYHGTGESSAADLLSSRRVRSGAVHDEGRFAGQRTGWDDGLYVAPTYRDAQQYGDHVVRAIVRKGDIARSSEVGVYNEATPGHALFHTSAGGVLPPDYPLARARVGAPYKPPVFAGGGGGKRPVSLARRAPDPLPRPKFSPLAVYAAAEKFADEGITAPDAAVDLAYRAQRGQLTPDEQAAVAAATGTVQRVLEKDYVPLADRGPGGSPIGAENLAAEPRVFDRVFRQWAIDEQGVQPKDLPENANYDEIAAAVMAANGPRAIQDIYEFHSTNASRNPADYPAPWRPPMDQAARAADTITKAQGVAGALAPTGAILPDYASLIPRTPYDMATAGVEARYMPSGDFTVQERARLPRHADKGDALTPGWYQPSHAYELDAGSPRAYSFEKLAGVIDRRIAAMADNASHVALRSTGRSTVELLDEDALASLKADADRAGREAVGRGARTREAKDVYNQAYNREYGALLLKTLRDGGPRLEPVPFDGDLTATLTPGQIDDKTLWIPAGLREAIAPYMTPDIPKGVLGAISKANGIWKRYLLPWRLTWHVGDATSGVFMSGVGAGVDPVTMRTRLSEAREMLKTPEGQRLFDAVENERGLLYGDAEVLLGREAAAKMPGAPQKPKGPLAPLTRATNWLFKANGHINEALRFSTTLELLDRELVKLGEAPIDPGDTARIGRISDAATFADDAPYAEAVRNAVNAANDALGDMINMSPFQRKYVRTIYPFWAWMRHVALFAGRLAVDHPARALLLMRIGEIVATDEELPPWVQGGFPLAGGVFGVGWSNPLADIQSLPGNPGAPDFARALTNPMSPALKWAAAGLLGANLTKGSRPLSRQGGAGDSTNKPLLLSPSRWDEMAYQVIKSFPQTRALVDLLPNGTFPGGVGRGQVIRYDSGQPVLTRSGQEVARDEPGWAPIASLFGIPYTSEQQIESYKSRQERRRSLLARQGGG